MNPPDMHYFPSLDDPRIESLALLDSRRTACLLQCGDPMFHSAIPVATPWNRD